MKSIDKLRIILGQEVKQNNGKRDFEVNIGEIARKIGCSSGDVIEDLNHLKYSGELMRLVGYGAQNDRYIIKVSPKSSILSQ